MIYSAVSISFCLVSRKPINFSLSYLDALYRVTRSVRSFVFVESDLTNGKSFWSSDVKWLLCSSYLCSESNRTALYLWKSRAMLEFLSFLNYFRTFSKSSIISDTSLIFRSEISFKMPSTSEQYSDRGAMEKLTTRSSFSDCSGNVL